MKLTEFFNTDYVDQASYDNLRKIGSLVDGQKNASRKILYTILEKNVKQEIKVSQLGSKVAEFAEYLHGSLENVIVGLCQDYAGTNNLPLLQKKGNFGTRFSNEASATRYIYCYGTDHFFNLFKKEDTAILKHQSFEGEKIEPMFYVPTLPILLINGSDGVSSGFAQKILPRKLSEIKKYILNRISNKRNRVNLTPFYVGFNGSVVKGEKDSQWKIRGIAEKTAQNKVLITELPIGYDLKGYLKVLDLLEDKKIIQSYRDLSENDTFKFEVTIPSKSLKSLNDDELLQTLKLVKTVTENYTVIDENNKIKVFSDVESILDHYIRVKLGYMQLRKDHLIESLTENIKLDFSKFLFIKMVTDETLIINKRSKKDIVSELDTIENIINKDDSVDGYDYLLNMPIVTLTIERMQKLENDIKLKKSQLDELKITSPEKLWEGEI